MQYIVSMDYSPLDFIYESNCTHFVDINYEFRPLIYNYNSND